MEDFRIYQQKFHNLIINIKVYNLKKKLKN